MIVLAFGEIVTGYGPIQLFKHTATTSNKNLVANTHTNSLLNLVGGIACATIQICDATYYFNLYYLKTYYYYYDIYLYVILYVSALN